MARLIVRSHSSISPSKTVSAGPVISTGALAARPFDRQQAAARLDVDPRRRAGRGGCRPPPRRRRRCRRPASRRRRARTRAGGCALRDDHLHEAGVDAAAAKRACVSIRGPCVATGAASTSATSCTACGLPIDTTATSTLRPSPSSSGQSGEAALGGARREPGRCRTARAAGSKIGRAHVDRHAAVGAAGAARGGGSWSRRASVVLSRQALVAHVADEAARAVAALLDLVAAAAVEDAVAEVDAGRRRRARRPGSGRRRRRSAGRPGAALRGVEGERRAGGVEHDEVVARALHLGEAQPHARIIDAASCAVRPDGGDSRLGLVQRGSPGGRVLKRLCTHRYCAGLRRISLSIQRFMRAASATGSSLGKSLHGAS